MTTEAIVQGAAGKAFNPVRDAFADLLETGEDLGASFCVFAEGEPVVDLFGGFADRKKEQPWTENSLACIYSSGKAVTSLLIAREVGAGRLSYDRPVAEYWPAFSAGGKAEVTVAETLSHQAGLCGFAEPMEPQDWLDWPLICERLAAMAPLWEPGTASGYHPQTAGFLAGELLRLTTGRTVGAILREDFTELRGVDLHCGLSGDEAARTVFMPKPPRPPDLGELNEFTKLAFLKPWSSPAKVSREEWMAAELPASNMHANARALAEIMSPFANNGRWPDGDQIIDPDALEQALEVRISGDDLVLPFHLTWAAGLMKNLSGHFGPSRSAYGHAGFGGSCVVVDPERGLSIAYVMNKMSPHLVGDPRAMRLIEATYDCL